MWRNHPEYTTEQEWERSLITTDRQKKPLHHGETGRECRGGMRGLAGLPQAADEVPEGHFSEQMGSS